MSVALYPGAATRVIQGGRSLVAAYGPVRGGFIYNPPNAAEQGIAPLAPVVGQATYYRGPINTVTVNGDVPPAAERAVTFSVTQAAYGPPEQLFVSLTGPITLTGSGDYVTSDADAVLQGGDTFEIPRDFPGNVWVAAVTTGHLFTVVVSQPPTQYPPTPYAGDFPPSSPVTKTTTIPSYLYKQYEDDDNLQALVAAQNRQTQDYVDTFNALDLPDVTAQAGALLDWVGEGLYGIRRPTLYSGRYDSTGPLNTVTPNNLPEIAGIRSVNSFQNVAATSDDVYKRVLIWHLWKADGRQVTADWLRRRCARFLFGEAGQGAANPISVVADASRDLSVTVVTGWVDLIGGALLNAMPLNVAPLNSAVTSARAGPTPALAPVLKEGIDTGALETPGQYNVTCKIGPVGTSTRRTEVLGLSNLLFN